MFRIACTYFFEILEIAALTDNKIKYITNDFAICEITAFFLNENLENFVQLTAKGRELQAYY